MVSYRKTVGFIKCRVTLSLLGLLIFSPSLWGDEVDMLIDAVRPRVWYSMHTPHFTANEEKFIFDSNTGKIEQSLWVIKDGDKYVAVWHEAGSKLYMVAPNPILASDKLELPARYDSGGNTFDGKLGTRITTFPFCHGFVQSADKRRYEFGGGWRNLTLTDTSIWNREYRTEAVYVLTFRCDRVLGYVVDMDVRLKTDKETGDDGNPFEPELVNFYPNHTFMQKMPGAKWRYEYTVYTPPDSDKYVGWINDFSQSDLADGVRLRNGGFSSFLFDPWQFGPALTCTVDEGISLRNATCNLQYDQHHLVSLPRERDINGFFNVRAKFRLVFLPREITNFIMSQVEITDWRSNEAYPIRVGVTEDFETDRLPETAEYAKGYKEPELSEGGAYSGRRCLGVDGESMIRIDMQPVPEPNMTYKLEAWIKVEKGKGEAKDAEAYILAQPSQWIPKGVELKPYQSASVKAGKVWEKITLEFKNGPLGATYWLFLVAKGPRCKAYFDDVLITMDRGF